MSHILILGGDGYLGWPTAMYFSNRGYDVTVGDNYFRRNACVELDVGMLYPVPTLIERARIWHELTGNEIKVIIGDLTDPEIMRSLFDGRVEYSWAINQTFTGIPDTVVHYAEQPSAPYSLINYKFANITLQNNLLVTLNLAWAVSQYAPDCHIIKLGTMGEYGTPNIDIPEGWLDVEHKGRSDRLLFPRAASSLYHTTKIMDTDLLWFYVRMCGLRVTDLMQGPVYGLDTAETMETGLSTTFHYDDIFGTVVNRFVTQAVADEPLTVYGSGGQTRGYINLIDTVECIRLAIENPAGRGELRVLNQITETLSVHQI
ncbi:MAG: NAD-dependent epimerase/dehydratase family protein, partial [Anaerolineales bacterium]|nr:NAD-dependent epimerase/dehydratase family protein [Anaerolineales bacterium]